jgi:AraC-like DNA-binding protein
MYSAQGEGVIIKPEFHENAMEIVEIQRGTVRFRIGAEIIELSGGDFLYIPAGSVFSAEAVSGEGSLRGIIFDKEIIESNMENYEEELLYMFYVQSENRVKMFGASHPASLILKRCMREAYDEYLSKDVCYKLPIRANIYLMMTSLLRYYCGSKNELDRMIYHNVMRLRPIISYISEHYKEKIYIETMSEMITVSPDYFTKMFKDSIGKTPIDYINALRINRAMQMLATTDTSVNDISDELGFSNSNYFHKIFKQYMETSPAAYRKMVKM